MTTSTLVVVPTFNEAENISALISAIRIARPDDDVLIVDDCSLDGTASVVRQLQLQGVFLLERASKLGLGSAYVAGFRWGLARQYQRFAQMDADFSHDPAVLPHLFSALDAGADVAVGSRNVLGGAVSGWGPLRHLVSKGGSFYSRVLLRAPVRDMTTGFKAFTRAALQTLDVETIRSNGYAFQIEMTCRALRRGLKVVELPIVFIDRRVGRSKMTRFEIWEAVVGVWRMRARPFG